MKSLTANWKTTLTGVIALIIAGIKIFDPSLMSTEVFTTIMTVLTGLGFVAAKDGNVTGGTTQQ